MAELLIACEMIRDELELAMARTGRHPETVWLEKGLHSTPERLRAAIQAEIDKAEETHDTILLTFSYCGGALDQLSSARATLAAPRFDDCIRMLLCHEKGCPAQMDCRSLYFTRQWMDSEGYFVSDFHRYEEMYGSKKAKKIIKTMLAHYEGYKMIDTGAYDLDAYRKMAQEDAAQLELQYSEVPGTVRVLEKLLRQELDEEFVVAKPGEKFSLFQFIKV